MSKPSQPSTPRQRKAKAKRAKPFYRWMHKSPSGNFFSIAYDESDVRRVLCQDKCDHGMKGYKLTKVRITEVV